MAERLQKILSGRGVSSRRAAEDMIAAGRVTVNGKTARIGDSADPERDDIRIDGAPLPPEEGRRYIMLNKPRGYVTTMSDERGRKTVAELVSDCPERLYPVGRLDMDSDGLLIMTNDGELAHRLAHPSHGIEKTYRVMVSGDIKSALPVLKAPMELDGGEVRAKRVEIARSGQTPGTDAALMITVAEGRNRQVRRMCETAGLRVARLTRVSEGALRLGGLKPGGWRELTPEEIKSLAKQ
ncbi:MAG: rRNA pseudouridine synthase [Oscillospiraceae bacterium]|jgi:23S rRNA pseudouridine2605 synthase|nr:rRNA pseudouridine synthase [Oscillospiraceae bacterium]